MSLTSHPQSKANNKATPAPQRVLTKSCANVFDFAHFFYFLEIIMVLKVSRLFTIVIKINLYNLY